MASCMPYLTGAPGLTPYGICCNSLGVLNQLAATRADRVAACSCIKAAAAGLPASCGPSISFAISPNMDGNPYVLLLSLSIYIAADYWEPIGSE
ncbi:hypothetical protein HU200_021237 [Digitaria exilis]|uniref:Bifunctional inhibitor/plant lipid transfer protein/seed storage helical domain-containing protein n=1 Tax=Digitaria exilis TaxID=1010633 RepID=A0A835F024_9POAL|nr:hypothetical protein HU200_021237 [Digitaria exilis]